MAFQNIGAAGGLIQAATISQPAGSYGGPDGTDWLTAAPAGGDRPGETRQVNLLLLVQVQLAERVGAFDITAADSGRLVSAAPAANEHGLPTNFGPGRDAWDALDLARFLWMFDPNDAATVGVAGTAGDISPNVIPEVRRQDLALGGPNGHDLVFDVHNVNQANGDGAAGGEGDLDMDLRLLYLGGIV